MVDYGVLGSGFIGFRVSGLWGVGWGVWRVSFFLGILGRHCRTAIAFPNPTSQTPSNLSCYLRLISLKNPKTLHGGLRYKRVGLYLDPRHKTLNPKP